jgi:tetratricopeptide (TPR) repeat protein
VAIGDMKGAESLIKKAMDEPGKADDPAALRVAVAVNLRLSRLDVAGSYLDRIAASSSATAEDQAWANRSRATLLMAAGSPADRDRAQTLIERNLSNDPESAEDLAAKATVLAARPARRREAIGMLERLAATNRLADAPRFLLAQLHLGQGEASKYEDEMRGLLDRKDKDPRHLLHFANHWIDRNQLDQAERWLAELKQADPPSLPALGLEARLLDSKKRRPELLKLLEARGRDVPDQIGAVAELLDRYGFVKEAEAAYKAFIARDPKQPERALALGTFLGRHERPVEAMEIFKQAWTTCRPERVALAALPIYAAHSTDETQKRQIEAWVAGAAQKRPDVVRLVSNLGVIYIQRGRFREAEDLLRKARESQPDNPDVLNSLAWLLALREGGKAEDALPLINHAIDITEGAVPALLDTRAVVLIRSGQLDQALRELDRARRGDPKNPNYVLHQAWALREQGKTDEARKALKESKELGWTIAKSDPLERTFINKLEHE